MKMFTALFCDTAAMADFDDALKFLDLQDAYNQYEPVELTGM